MKRMIYRLMHVYSTYRMFLWLGGVVAGVGTPLVGYALHAFGVLKRKREISADDPEDASDMSAGTLFSWLRVDGGVAARVVSAIMLIAVALLVFLLVFQFISWFTRDAEWSTGSEHEPETADDEYGDGYGVEDDEGDGDALDGFATMQTADDGFAPLEAVNIEGEVPDGPVADDSRGRTTPDQD